jgi:hypothetical protein
VSDKEDKIEEAARTALADIVNQIKSDPAVQSYEEKGGGLDNAAFIELLDQCFKVLDPDNNGISRAELVAAMSMTARFSKDELVMIALTAKYFSLIANMSEDEIGEETVITLKDKAMLTQLLREHDLNLAELHLWCFTRDGKVRAFEPGMGPPPLSHDSKG